MIEASTRHYLSTTEGPLDSAEDGILNPLHQSPSHREGIHHEELQLPGRKAFLLSAFKSPSSSLIRICFISFHENVISSSQNFLSLNTPVTFLVLPLTGYMIPDALSGLYKLHILLYG